MNLEFSACKEQTLGAEIELQLLDLESLNLVDKILPLLERVGDDPLIKAEIIQNTVEVNSRICRSASELYGQLRSTVADLLEHCRELGMCICGAGTHPFCRRLATITPLPRYQRMEQEAGYLSHNQITYATHVHVGMSSGDEAIRTMRLLTPCLPLLLALAASSPFWRGYETGHVSYRHRLLAATPDFGIPPYFADWAGFREFFEAARRAGMAQTIKDVHWDIRPHPDFGTLEVRVLDVQPTVRRSVTLAALIHMLATYFAATPPDALDARVPRQLPHWIEKRNHYEAAMLGLDADYIVDAQGNTRPIRDLIIGLIDLLAGTARDMGCAHEHRRVAGLLDDVSYLRQRQVLQHGGSMRAVVADLVRQLEGELLAAVA